MLALDQVREAGGEFHDFLAAGDFAERVGDHLAVLGGDDLRQFALALVQQLAEAEDDLLALGDGEVAPGREGLVRRGDGGFDVLGVAQADELRLLAKGRVKNRRERSPEDGTLAADPVRDNLQFGVIRHSLLFLGE